MKHNYGKLLFPSLLLFFLVSALFMLIPGFWDDLGISHRVVVVSNILLYTISALTIWMHLMAIKNPNPNVFSRSVMASTVIKLFVFGIAVVIYLLMAGTSRSVLGIFTSMLLYVAYTILDVKTALLLNKKA
jgi:hypothetical protein